MTPIRTATDTALKAINVGNSGGSAMLIAITPDGKTAYVRSGVHVVPINTSTDTAGKPVDIPFSQDMAMAITPNGKLFMSWLTTGTQ